MKITRKQNKPLTIKGEVVYSDANVTMITSTEAAHMIGPIGRAYVTKLIRAGAFPGARKLAPYSNSHYLIPKHEVEAWIKNHGLTRKRARP